MGFDGPYLHILILVCDKDQLEEKKKRKQDNRGAINQVFESINRI
jgi:hypothetical protein